METVLRILGLVLLVATKWAAILGFVQATLVFMSAAISGMPMWMAMLLRTAGFGVSLFTLVWLLRFIDWLGTPQSTYRLRHLKAAARQGYWEVKLKPNEKVTRHTECLTKDASGYFKSWKWVKVKDQLWDEEAY